MAMNPALFAKTSPRPARWTVRSVDRVREAAIAAHLGIHPAVARVLAARDWTESEDDAEFLNPRLASLRDPFELADMQTAVDRTVHAIRHHEKIGVFGDYDVDGICSTALMLLVLRRLGAEPVHFIPHRVLDGYGMSIERVEELAHAGVRLLITVDTGITAVDEIRRAHELGMDVVVTDHHLPEGGLPDAVAIVNPNRPDAPYDGASLCGTGVAFKFAHALLKCAGEAAESARAFLRGLLDLVALATIADVVPLVGENRILVHHGLQCLSRTRRPGLRALLAESKLSGTALNPHHVGFVIGPRLNAAGRTDHAGTALDLLLTESANEATVLANKLSALNRQRRSEEASIVDDAVAQAESQLASGLDSILVVAGLDYHLGVVGIVASRLVERFHRPAIVLRIDPERAKGSARSIPGFDIHEALSACAPHLLTFGGHAMAAGLQVAPEHLDDFRAAINDHARPLFEQRDLSPEILVDAPIDGTEITWEFYHDLQRLQPFGEQNAAPLFLLGGARPVGAPRVVGTNHLKVALRSAGSTFPAIGFRLGHLLTLCESQSHSVDVVFRPTENTWQGRTDIQLELQDMRPAAV
ncbi:MAG: single-stranded-DNA-specific exonuclease [Candidatus Sumerlaeota bacterium]|nr:single-stranded-DNA-specific exonuclease [Candidatus Sumerlaeota bacterium]